MHCYSFLYGVQFAVDALQLTIMIEPVLHMCLDGCFEHDECYSHVNVS